MSILTDKKKVASGDTPKATYTKKKCDMSFPHTTKVVIIFESTKYIRNILDGCLFGLIKHFRIDLRGIYVSMPQ